VKKPTLVSPSRGVNSIPCPLGRILNFTDKCLKTILM
jgi:hypothetical protein